MIFVNLVSECGSNNLTDDIADGRPRNKTRWLVKTDLNWKKKKKESFSRGNKHKVKEKYLLTKS